ncbi:geranylgeranyl reductase family protein [Amycolatopsis acidiphila]|uniref:Geranylgeranyl reductase family protein n=1 Tax=Amycolatopsis acidiphila TaxID=715473 RepID=A0A558A5R5_9PSEU|nr:geranylgeranyl reductase family protein [Amycolatopsis acidiphila]TVT19568.1 geranylgeranyl reductase family protein [Amycolatopsis acidiphila]UIJ60545.1 geranylgeranyl reductase family protein [Amycolatopsis acidiphila]GHG82245.1 drug:proton antiporter [Amycolatopsis acidiphila]
MTADAQVIVVGAGPAGSTVATYLARAGVDVLLLEKTEFPREKVCGDGLTPRGVKQLIDLGIDTSQEAGWVHSRGLRILTGDLTLELDWPDLTSYPPYGVSRTRHDFDDLLAKIAVKAGARLQERTTVTGAITDERTGRVVGVEAKTGPEKTPVSYRAPLVLACDGVSARLARSVGIETDDKRPMGVAVRRYYKSPRHDDPFIEGHLELWDRSDPRNPKLLPGYGWAFPLGDGTVNVGLGMLSTTKAFRNTDYRALLRSWLDSTPGEWGYREENAVGRIGGAGLPMGFNRTPHYRDGLLLLGDAGGMVSPFNGEGISSAMESAQLAAEFVVQALARPEGPSRERALHGYPLALKELMGGYYRLGNVFAKAIGHPKVMRVATKYGLRVNPLIPLIYKGLSGCYDAKGGDSVDRMIALAARVTPSA